MSSENLDQLYGEIIMEHQREPRCHGHLSPCDREEEVLTPCVAIRSS